LQNARSRQTASILCRLLASSIQPGLSEALHQIADQLGLDFTVAPSVPIFRITPQSTRLGVWVPWADTDSIGWVRYSRPAQSPYIYIRDEDIRSGKLNDKIDVLLYGHVDLELAEQIQGLPKRWSQCLSRRRRKLSTSAFRRIRRHHCGIGYQGLAQIQDFVERGGLLITLGSGSMLPLEAGSFAASAAMPAGVPRSTQGGVATLPQPRSAPQRAPLAPSPCLVRSPRSSIAYGYSPHTYDFARIFRCTPSPAVGCAWPTAPPASMDP